MVVVIVFKKFLLILFEKTIVSIANFFQVIFNIFMSLDHTSRPFWVAWNIRDKTWLQVELGVKYRSLGHARSTLSRHAPPWILEDYGNNYDLARLD